MGCPHDQSVIRPRKPEPCFLSIAAGRRSNGIAAGVLERGGVYHTGNEGLEEGDEAAVG